MAVSTLIAFFLAVVLTAYNILLLLEFVGFAQETGDASYRLSRL